MNKEALKLALEALTYIYTETTADEDELIDQAITAIKKALAQPDQYAKGYADAMNWKTQNHLEHLPVTQPEQEPVAWKLVPIEPTREMLEAMDECSIEGYDEHLYAGHAASVYMAAVDVAPTPPQPKEPEQGEPVAWLDEYGNAFPLVAKQYSVVGKHWKPLYTTPPQRTWVGLTDDEMHECWGDPLTPLGMKHARMIEAQLKEKNNG